MLIVTFCEMSFLCAFAALRENFLRQSAFICGWCLIGPGHVLKFDAGGILAGDGI
jgi:hypothetical protein